MKMGPTVFLREPESQEQGWHLRWLWRVTPRLPPSVPKRLVVTASRLSVTSQVAQGKAAQGFEEGQGGCDSQFLLPGRGAGIRQGQPCRADSPSRVFCHQPITQGRAAGESLNWNNFLCSITPGKLPARTSQEFPGKVVGNEKCYKAGSRGWRVSALPRPRRSERGGLSCETEQFRGKKRRFFASWLLQRSGVTFPAGQGMLHGRVPANTRNTWARFQAPWLWASHLTLGISVPPTGKEASCSSWPPWHLPGC